MRAPRPARAQDARSSLYLYHKFRREWEQWMLGHHRDAKKLQTSRKRRKKLPGRRKHANATRPAAAAAAVD